ncbi:hypothetical protein SLA2020_435430 [Shorea laevis]
MGAMKTKPWLLFVLFYCRACFSIAGDSLSAGHSLSFSKRETLLSQGGTFELGFFKPGTSSNIYLGIWYKRFVPKEVVWVANKRTLCLTHLHQDLNFQKMAIYSCLKVPPISKFGRQI